MQKCTKYLKSDATHPIYKQQSLQWDNALNIHEWQAVIRKMKQPLVFKPLAYNYYFPDIYVSATSNKALPTATA